MILDTSALNAILRDEPDAPLFAEAIERAVSRRISAVNFLESAIGESLLFKGNDFLHTDVEPAIRPSNLPGSE